MGTRVVLITGASSGIGKCLALEYAKRGAHLVLLARRLGLLEETANECRKSNPGIRIGCYEVDVTDRDAMQSVIEKASVLIGEIDTVVANAGFGVVGKVETLKAEDFRRQLETNFFGVLNSLYPCIEMLKQNKGRIGIVGSVSSYFSFSDVAPYTVSKYAVRALAETLYLELSRYSVSTTLICPGFVESQIRMVDNKGKYDSNRHEPVPAYLVMPGEKAAKKIVDAIEKRKREKYLTRLGALTIILARMFQGPLYFILRQISIRSKESKIIEI